MTTFTLPSDAEATRPPEWHGLQRDDPPDGTRDTVGLHFPHELVLAQRHGPMRRLAGGPRTFRRVGSPDVNLRIDDEDAFVPCYVPGACARRWQRRKIRFYMRLLHCRAR